MWILVLGEVQNLNEPMLSDLITLNKARFVKFVQHVINAAVVVWQDLCSDSLGAIFQTSGTVCQAPQASE